MSACIMTSPFRLYTLIRKATHSKPSTHEGRCAIWKSEPLIFPYPIRNFFFLNVLKNTRPFDYAIIKFTSSTPGIDLSVPVGYAMSGGLPCLGHGIQEYS